MVSGRDRTAFGGDADPLAAAQAHLLNAFQQDFLDKRRGAGRLLTVPTEYSGTGTSPYRERFAALVGDKVVLLVGDDAPVPEGETLSTGDAAARDRLEYLGHPVVVSKGKDSVPGDAEGKAAVVISSTLPSGDIKDKFRDAAVPVLTWEAYVLDDMAMATNPGETFRVSRVRISNAASPLAAGLSGEVPVYRGEDRLRWGTPGAGADTAAPDPRVALFLGDEGLDPEVLTDEGRRLFDAAVRYALG